MPIGENEMEQQQNDMMFTERGSRYAFCYTCNCYRNIDQSQVETKMRVCKEKKKGKLLTYPELYYCCKVCESELVNCDYLLKKQNFYLKRDELIKTFDLVSTDEINAICDKYHITPSALSGLLFRGDRNYFIPCYANKKKLPNEKVSKFIKRLMKDEKLFYKLVESYNFLLKVKEYKEIMKWKER